MTQIRRRTSIWAAMAALLVIAAGMIFAGYAAAQGSNIDYDADDDGLIEVSNLAQLNAIFWDLNGDGAVASADTANYSAAYPNAKSGMGCNEDETDTNDQVCLGYELTANLDLDTNNNGQADSGDSYWNSGQGWRSIGYQNSPYEAIFDGNGHVIRNLHINRQWSYHGLFGITGSDSEVRNVGLENAYVYAGARSGDQIGALIGENQGTVTAAYSSGHVTGDVSAGGLVGRNEGTVSESYSTAMVTSSGENIGGLSGSNSGTVTNSYASGQVVGDDTFSSFVGGLVGYNADTITNSYATGAVSGGSYVGGLVGGRTLSDNTISNSYWNTTTSGQMNSDGGVGKTTAELQTPTSNTGIYATWPAAKWEFKRQVQYPALKVDFNGDGTATALEFGAQRADYDTNDDGLIEVANLAQLDAIRWDLDANGVVPSATDEAKYLAAFPKASADMGCPSAGCTGYQLTADLNFDTNSNGKADAGDTYWNSGAGWTPIGAASTPYTAVFDGDGRALQNLFVKSTAGNDLGLFGAASSVATLRGISLEQVHVKGLDRVGGLVGDSAATIKRSSVSGQVSGGDSVGGLVGRNAGSVENSYSTAAVTGEDMVGGVLGENTGSVDSAYSAGKVTGENMLGGLIGKNAASISVAYSTGAVSGEDMVGGLIGENAGSVTSTYATGAVTGSNQVGGLVGDAITGASFSAVYSIGAASGQTDVGGLLGRSIANSVTAGYWDTTVSGVPNSAGGLGQTTAQLQTPASNTGVYATWPAAQWDFGGNRQYPVLKTDLDGDGTATSLEFGAQRVDYDTDDDGLIELKNLAQLNLLRHDLDGDGDVAATDAVAYSAAWPQARVGMGCNDDETLPTDQVCVGYELTANLDFDTNDDGRTDVAGDTYWNGGKGWDPIGSWHPSNEIEFNAVFDGNGHTLRNLFINRSVVDYLGLFGGLESKGEILNLGLQNIHVAGSGGSSSLGGLAGYVDGGEIHLSYVTGTVISDGDYIGGLAGQVSQGTVSRSYSVVAVRGDDGVGGLAGRYVGGTVSDVYSLGRVVGSSEVGGLLGDVSGATVDSVYSIGHVSGSADIGGLVGKRSQGSVTHGYWDTETGGQANSAGGVGKTTAELQAPTSNTGIYADWDAARWDFGGTVQYPSLKADFNGDGTATSLEFGIQRIDYDTDNDGLIEINNLTELNAIRWDPDADGVADFKFRTDFRLVYPAPMTNMGCPSAGCDGYELMTSLDFDTNANGKADAGDAYWNEGKGWEPIGTTGSEYNAVFEGNGYNLGNLFVGSGGNGRGLFGLAASQSALRNFGLTNGRVVAANDNDVGMLVGSNAGSVSAVYVTGSVSGGDNVGGLVGFNQSGGTVQRSYSTASVSGGDRVGGLIGDNQGSASSVYAAASVSGDHAAGGLVGRNKGSVAAVYSTGAVTADANAGGLAGATDQGTATNSYWDTMTSGLSASAGGVGKTTAELQEPTGATGIYAQWNTAHWDFGGTIQYPALKADYNGDGAATAVEFGSQRIDYDTDDDRLIEVSNLAQLSAIRWNLNGDGHVDNAVGIAPYTAAFPKAVTGKGCPSPGCLGYELTSSFDFDTNGNGKADSGDAYWNNGDGWEPIGTTGAGYGAVFEGNGHTISNLFVGSGGGYLGLFGHAANGSEIRNFGLANGRVAGGSGDGYVGMLVGSNAGVVSAIFATGSVSGGDHAGGLVGSNLMGGSVSRAYSTAPVSGGDSSGGLAGSNRGMVNASYATGSVSGDDNVGGLVGDNDFGTVTSSYSAGKPSGDNAVGGLVGSSASGTVTTSYWDTETSEQANSPGGAGHTTAELQTPTSNTGIYSTWDSGTWSFVTRVHYPALKADFNGDGKATAQEFGNQVVDYDIDDDGLIEVSTLAQLNAIRWDLNGDGDSGDSDYAKLTAVFFNADTSMGCPASGCVGYELMNDLDFDTNSDSVVDADDEYWNDGKGWDSIGWHHGIGDYTLDGEFSGILEGNNRVIRNLYAGTTSKGYLGLFGVTVDGAEIRNLRLEDMNIAGTSGPKGDDYVGGLVSHNGGTLRNVHVVGKVFGDDSVGGLVGRNIGLIIGSGASIYVNGDYYVGGLAGFNDDGQMGRDGGGLIRESYSTGAVRGHANVGGLVGLNGDGIVGSYSNASTRGHDGPWGLDGTLGGLVGESLDGWIEDSYAMGETAARFDVAGLIGHNTGSLTRVFATGRVKSIGYPGGLTANNQGSIVDGFWDRETTQQSSSQGGSGKTTAELQTPTSNTGIYAGWSTSRWDFGGQTQYPALKADINGDGVATAREFGNQRMVYDTDADRLVEVSNLAELNAIRWDANGDGQVDSSEHQDRYNAVFPNHDTNMGCPDPGCLGYELTVDLDLDTSGNGKADTDDDFWNDGAGWNPIASYAGVLEGNGHAINNLYINRDERGRSGFFSRLTDGAQVRNLALSNVDITSNGDAGAFAGLATRASISNSYATGLVVVHSNHDSVGGLVGEASGHPNGHDTISDSYSLVKVVATGVRPQVGGLVGSMHVNQSSVARIVNSFAAGAVQANDPSRAGGLVGHTGIPDSSIAGSYWDTQTTGWLTSSQDGDGYADDGVGRTKQELQLPTSTSGIYTDWNSSVWDFGTGSQYPALKYDTDGDGAATVAEFGDQPRSADDFVRDLDLDEDGLIEVSTLAQLNAIRWDASGDGVVADADKSGYGQAFASWRPTLAMGCTGVSCVGYELTADLDLDTNDNGRADSDDAYWNAGKGWQPIGSYSGVLDGRGYAIRNLHINRAGDVPVGLFGEITNSGEVRNLALTNVDILSGGDAGAFAGRIMDSGISGSYATGSVTGNGDDASTGGLVGEANGRARNGSIVDSYSLVEVTSMGHGSTAGGLAGTLGANGASQPWIENSFAAGLVQSSEPDLGGGLVGDASTDFPWISGSYWDRQTTGWDTSAGGGSSRSRSDLQRLTSAKRIYHAWNDSVWDFGNESQYPALKAMVDFDGQIRTAPIPVVDLDRDNDGLIEIDSHETRVKLNAIRWDLDGDGIPSSNADDYWNAFTGGTSSNTPCVGALCHGYELLSDVDLGGSSNEWESIGVSDDFYNAEFNGNGHRVRNLWQVRTGGEGNSHVGLFGFAGGDALLHGVILNDVYIEVWGDEHDDNGVNVAGALVAVNHGIVRNSAMESSDCDVIGRNVAGGLVGANHGVVEQSWSNCTWVKSFKGSGGLVGLNYAGAKVSNSYVGHDTIAYNPRIAWYAGALVGRNFGTVEKSLSLGKTRPTVTIRGPMNGQQAGDGVTVDSYFLGHSNQEHRGGTLVSYEQMKTPRDAHPGIFTHWNYGRTGVWDLGDAVQYTVLRVDVDGDAYGTPWEQGNQRVSNGFDHRPNYDGDSVSYTVSRDDVSLRFRKASSDGHSTVAGVGYRIAQTGEACAQWSGNSVVKLDETNGRATLSEVNGVYTLVLDRRDTWAFRPGGRVCVDVWLINYEGEKSDARRWHDIHMPSGEAPRSKPIKKAEAIIGDGAVALWFETNPYDWVKGVGYRVANTGDACEGWTGTLGTLRPGDEVSGATLAQLGSLWRLGLTVGDGYALKPNRQYCVDVWTFNDDGNSPGSRRWRSFVTSD